MIITHRTPRRPTHLATLLTLALAAVMSAGCASELDSKAFFPKTWESDYAKIASCEKSGVHGNYVNTWVSKDAEDAWKNKTYPFAQDTVFVKVNYEDSKCSDIKGYFAMKKGPDDTDGAAGDWIWQKLDADGQEEGQGQMAGCTGCHSSYKDNDYVGTLP